MFLFMFITSATEVILWHLSVSRITCCMDLDEICKTTWVFGQGTNYKILEEICNVVWSDPIHWPNSAFVVATLPTLSSKAAQSTANTDTENKVPWHEFRTRVCWFLGHHVPVGDAEGRWCLRLVQYSFSSSVSLFYHISTTVTANAHSYSRFMGERKTALGFGTRWYNRAVIWRPVTLK